MQSHFGLPEIRDTVAGVLGSNNPMSAALGADTPVLHVPDNDDHERISALFIGPKGENLDTLQRCFNMIVEKQRAARLSYFPEDKVCALFCCPLSRQ